MPLLILMSQVGMIQTMPLDCTGAGVGEVGGGGVGVGICTAKVIYPPYIKTQNSIF